MLRLSLPIWSAITVLQLSIGLGLGFLPGTDVRENMFCRKRLKVHLTWLAPFGKNGPLQLKCTSAGRSLRSLSLLVPLGPRTLAFEWLCLQPLSIDILVLEVLLWALAKWLSLEGFLE